MGTAFGLPSLPSLSDPSIIADADELQRRQMIAEMLRRQSMAPSGGTQMAGQIAIKNSPWEGVAKAFQAYMATKGDEENTKARQDLTAKQAAAMGAQVDSLFGTTPAQPVPTRPAGVTADALASGGFPQPPEPAPQQVQPSAEVEDIKRKAKAALLMGNKELANKLLGDLWTQTPEMKNLAFKGQDPKEVGRLETAKLRKDSMTTMSPDQVLLDASNKPVYSAPSAPSSQGKMMADLLKGAGIDANSPQGQAAYGQLIAKETTHPEPNKMMTNVNSFLPASEEAQRDFMKGTRTTYDTLKQAPVALESIEKAKALVPAAKGFMGPGGEGLLEAAKFLNNRLGMNIKTEGVKSAEELRTRVFFNVLDNLKKMDASPSQQQQAIMQDALGKLGTDPNALPQVLDAFGDAIRGKVQLHNQEVQSAVQRGVKFPYDPTIALPSGPKDAAPAKTVVRTGTQNGKKVVQYSDGTVDYAP